MCLASSLMSVIVFIKRRSLVGEALSHAAYPGIAMSVLIFGSFFDQMPSLFPVVTLGGALLSSLIAMKFIVFLEEKLSFKSDSALCFVLSMFLGMGILIASRLQHTDPIWFQKIQMFLFGQAATMLSTHAIFYGILMLLTLLFVLFFFFRLQLLSFDKHYARVLGEKVEWIEFLTIFFIATSVIIGIRSVGVVLMAGMLIAPAAGARQLTSRLSTMFLLSACFGGLSAFLGNYFSVNGSLLFMQYYPGSKISLPTGPMILIVASFITLLTLLFAPRRGLLSRLLRRQKFQLKVLRENVLKELYKMGGVQRFAELKRRHLVLLPILVAMLTLLQIQGYLEKVGGSYRLLPKGEKKALRIIRLHRLWEVYLFTCLGYGAEKVHTSAEEMEHILTPELEEKLSLLLNDPKKDPHDQMIPAGEA